MNVFHYAGDMSCKSWSA